MHTLDCFIPAHNEAAGLETNVQRLVTFCRRNLAITFRVIIAENGSTDATPAIADMLSATYPEVDVLHYAEKGRGNALRRAFLGSRADYIGYMDADMSTHLESLPETLKRLAAGADLVIGSRLLPGSHTLRRLYREVLSRVYNRLVRALFRSSIVDHQCGFKFMTHAACARLVPRTQDNLWFFDTELLILAELGRMRIDELAVDWTEDLGSTVNIARTIVDDLRAMVKLFRRLHVREDRSAAP